MSERNYRLMQALIEKQFRSLMAQGLGQHELEQMVVHEVDCAERCYPGFKAYCLAENSDLLNWYDTL